MPGPQPGPPAELRGLAPCLHVVFLQLGPLLASVAPEPCQPEIKDPQGPLTQVRLLSLSSCRRSVKSQWTLSTDPEAPSPSPAELPNTSPHGEDISRARGVCFRSPGHNWKTATSCTCWGRAGGSWRPVSKAAPAVPRWALHMCSSQWASGCLSWGGGHARGGLPSRAHQRAAQHTDSGVFGSGPRSSYTSGPGFPRCRWD